MTTAKTTTRRQLKPITAREIEARSRARDLRVRVYVVEPACCYYTKSQSGDAEGYHVARDVRGDWTCECKGFHYTGCCKHIAQVERRAEREGWTFGHIARH